MVEKMEKYGHIDETNGVLSLEKIKELCSEVFESRNVEYCYLFGSYAKGKATETSDVDLLIATSDSGLRFFDLVESLRESLCKKVDVLTLEQLNDNTQLLNEILKDGIRIYG
jgi:predicted nucleotidyltransferase